MPSTAFKLIVLGCSGGISDFNLSSYLVAKANSDQFLALDAGSLAEGIICAYNKGSFNDLNLSFDSNSLPEIQILSNHIKAYLISHAHLDHVKGLVICSTIDSKKSIYGLPETINHIRDHLFNNIIWPNFGNEGNRSISKYTYIHLSTESPLNIPEVDIQVESFPLDHPKGYLSTAFLLNYENNYLLYFGDTSPDELGSNKYIHKVWKRIIPLIREKKLKAIFIECSYPNSYPDKELYGHLKPVYLINQLSDLANLVDPEHPEAALYDLKIFITHIKASQKNTRELILQELIDSSNLNVKFIFPQQGDIFYL